MKHRNRPPVSNLYDFFIVSKIEIRTRNPQGACVVLEKMGIVKYSIISDDILYVFEGFERTEEMITGLVTEMRFHLPNMNSIS